MTRPRLLSGEAKPTANGMRFAVAYGSPLNIRNRDYREFV